MTTNGTLESRVLNAIRSGHSTFTAIDVNARGPLESGPNGFRKTDRILQRLRRNGTLGYDRRSGWSIIAPPPPDPVTDGERLKFGLELVDEIAAYAQSTNPERDWDQTHKAVCDIYEVTHSILSPDCRKNHPEWIAKLDAYILKRRSEKALP